MRRPACFAGLAFALSLGYTAPALAAAPSEAPAGAVPDYRSAEAPVEASPPLSVPGDGMGAFGFAGVSLGYAALGFAGTADLIVRDKSPVFWGLALGSAIPATIMGATAIGLGVRNRRRYQAWSSETGIDAPKQGNGMIASGAMLLIGGSGAITLGGLSAFFNSGFEESSVTPTPLDPLAVGVGVGSIVAGSALLIAGAARNGKFKRWRLDGPGVALTPTFGPTRGGFSVGLSGRF